MGMMGKYLFIQYLSKHVKTSILYIYVYICIVKDIV